MDSGLVSSWISNHDYHTSSSASLGIAHYFTTSVSNSAIPTQTGPETESNPT